MVASSLFISLQEKIKTALDNFERIAVYGDYDADGVTATALLYSYLALQGADVVFAMWNLFLWRRTFSLS